MNCPKCNAPVPPNQRFCGSCGAKMELIDNNRTMAADDVSPEVPRDYGYTVPEEQPARDYGYTVPEEQPARDYGYTVPEEQPARDYGYTVPEEQPVGNNYGYSKSERDFSSQYNDYQKSSQYSGGHGGYDYNNGGFGYNNGGGANNKKVMIIVIAIAAAIVIAGAVVGIVLGAKSCSNDDNKGNGNSTSGSVNAGGSHRVTSGGIVIVEDEDINTADSEAQAKLEEYISTSGKKTMEEQYNQQYSQYFHTSISAQGNAIVVVIKFTDNISESDKSEFTQSMKQSTSNQGNVKSETGVSNAVAVLGILNSDGSIYYTRTSK